MRESHMPRSSGSGKSNTNRKSTRKKKVPYTARTADRQVLYEAAVQSVEPEIDFVDKEFKRLRGRHAAKLREDFCATAATSAEWVKRRPTNLAVGVDLDQSCFDWYTKNRKPKLSDDQASRLKLVRADVRDSGPAGKNMDVVIAANFSYFIFQKRPEMLAYFASVRKSLAPDGLFILDHFGGSHVNMPVVERRRCKGFTYIWEQTDCDPIDNSQTCYISFEFRDGTKMKRAFSYHWRMWSLAEIREILAEAGFSKSTVYWEGDNKNGGGNGVFKPVTKGEACYSFIDYIIAEK